MEKIRADQVSLPFFAVKPEVSLAAGEVLTADMVQVIALPAGFDALTQYAIPANEESREWLIDRRVTRDIPRGPFCFISTSLTMSRRIALLPM